MVSRVALTRYHEFEGGCIVTLGPSEVGFAYNVPSHCESVEMGRGVVLIPPGTWVIRAPIHLAKNNFEATTTGRRVGSTITYVQEVNVGVMELAKPRLVYVPYNHCAMFIDGSSSVICKQVGLLCCCPGDLPLRQVPLGRPVIYNVLLHNSATTSLHRLAPTTSRHCSQPPLHRGHSAKTNICDPRFVSEAVRLH